MHGLIDWIKKKRQMQQYMLRNEKKGGNKRLLRHERFELSRNIHCEAETAKINLECSALTTRPTTRFWLLRRAPFWSYVFGKTFTAWQLSIIVCRSTC
jgi:hypothetical protein